MSSMKALESVDLSSNPLDFDALPEAIFRLNEMYGLLHSKAARRKVIGRAINIRPAVRKVVLSEALAAHDAPPATPGAEGEF